MASLAEEEKHPAWELVGLATAGHTGDGSKLVSLISLLPKSKLADVS